MKTLDEKYFSTGILEMDVNDLLNDDYTYADLEFAINNFTGDQEYMKIAKFHSASAHANMMIKSDFETWRDNKDGIKVSGQLDPIYLYRGQVVDGRHRVRALLSCGITKILYRKLRNNLTLEEVKSVHGKKENRRHKTKTQTALNLYIENNCANKSNDYLISVADKSEGAISLRQLQRVHQIFDLIGKTDERIEALRQGGAYKKLDGRSTISLQAIIDDIKMKREIEVNEIIAASSNSDPDDLHREHEEYQRMKDIFSALLKNIKTEAEKLAVQDVLKENSFNLMTDSMTRKINAAHKEMNES